MVEVILQLLTWKPTGRFSGGDLIQRMLVPFRLKNRRAEAKEHRGVCLSGGKVVGLGSKEAIVGLLTSCKIRHRFLRNAPPAKAIEDWLKQRRAGERFIPSPRGQCREMTMPDFADFPVNGRTFRSACELSSNCEMA